MDNWQLTSLTWETEEHSTPVFENDVYSAIAAGNTCAIARKDKNAINTFKQIMVKVGKGAGDVRDRLSESEQSFIRRWYLKSLEQ